jgi:hypothetical protein
VQKTFRAAALTVAALALCAGTAQAAGSNIDPSSTITPLILAGDYASGFSGGYNPLNLVDANVPTSAFSGVVSINIVNSGGSFICSGALLSSMTVLTAGHCVDLTGNGVVMTNLNTSSNSIRVLFNNNNPTNNFGGATSIFASNVWMSSNYQGFGNCPVGVNSFCVNDDVALLTLASAAPVTAKRYSILTDALSTGDAITMVGYGTSGNGQVGAVSNSTSFYRKKVAQNRTDLFDLNDEQGFAAGPQEVWYADFDGVNTRGQNQDLFCDAPGWGNVCTPSMGTNVEGNIGGGDSGGPSFVMRGGQYVLVGNNTFGGSYSDQKTGVYGTYFGGMALAAYATELSVGAASIGGAVTLVPEPSSYALMLLGLMAVGGTALRRGKAA